MTDRDELPSVVGGVGELVGPIVHEVMVMPAEQAEVGQRGGAAWAQGWRWWISHAHGGLVQPT